MPIINLKFIKMRQIHINTNYKPIFSQKRKNYQPISLWAPQLCTNKTADFIYHLLLHLTNSPTKGLIVYAEKFNCHCINHYRKIEK